MSLFGKILAVLNLLGAAGLIYFASADYSKRQAWAHAYMRGELLLTGLPLDDKELDSSSQPVVDRLGEADLADMFKSAGGRPVSTQAQELEAVKGQLGSLLSATEQNKPQQTALLGRILLPLADSYLEREQMLAARANFGTDQAFQNLRGRCAAALKQATDPNTPNKPFRESFRVAFHSLPGEPAEYFVSLLLRNYTDDRRAAAAVNLDQAIDQAMTAQLAGLTQRYNAVVNEASGLAPDESRKAPDAASRKAAIARLLFGLCVSLTEQAFATDSADAGEADRQRLAAARTPAERQSLLIQTEAFNQRFTRMLVVCGLRAALTAVSERGAAVRRLYDYAQNATAEERQQFVNDHNFRLSVVREMASLVKGEQQLIGENKERLLGYETVGRERAAEIAQLKEEYSQMRASTAKEVANLRDLSRQVLDLRVMIRNALETTERNEEQIRALEKQIRDKSK
jgi:hypothetical protein